MTSTETIKLAFSAIWAHKLRSFLTLLGMIIGVTAFMVVLSLLQGFNAYVDEKIAGIGSEPIIGEIEKRDIVEGRFFSPPENDNSARVAYVGMDVAKKFFPMGGAV